VLLQMMQKQQLDEKKVALLEANNVDEMYETLAIYEQKVPTADQVKHDDLREGLQLFLQELVAVRAGTDTLTIFLLRSPEKHAHWCLLLCDSIGNNACGVCVPRLGCTSSSMLDMIRLHGGMLHSTLLLAA
jgi:hypothetical protein